MICALHKMKNIIKHKSISKKSIGEDYFKLLKKLPFNPYLEKVNKIIYSFILSSAATSSKLYI